MSKQFKVGDKVRLISTKSGPDNWGWMTRYMEIGDVATISIVGESGISFSDNPLTICSNAYLDFFELVVDASNLEELVKRANEGFEAVRNIYDNHFEAVTLRRSNDGLKDRIPPLYSYVHEFIIKPKAPVFEPFMIGSWNVHVDNRGILFVGCNNFDAKEAKEALLTICAIYGPPTVTKGNITLICSRKGVLFENHSITWEDADKLLAALSKAGF